MPSHKVSMRASMSNQTTHFGIMGGLFNRKISGRSSMNRVTSRLEIPASAKEGYQYMKMHNLLSRNPLGSGGVGRMFTVRPRGSGLGSSGLGSSNVNTLQDEVPNNYIQVIETLLRKHSDISFIINIQYYNTTDDKGNVLYTSYDNMFGPQTAGKYPNTTIAAISEYFNPNTKYTSQEHTRIMNSLVIGKPINKVAGPKGGYVSDSSLNSWITQWNSLNTDSKVGGYMYWSAGQLAQGNVIAQEMNKILRQNPDNKNRVIYIAGGDHGYLYSGDASCNVDTDCSYIDYNSTLGVSCQSNVCTYMPMGLMPGTGIHLSILKTILKSYNDAGFNTLILSFWNKSKLSSMVEQLKFAAQDFSAVEVGPALKNVVDPGTKILVSGGGDGQPKSVQDVSAGYQWGHDLGYFAASYNLDGVDLDLESPLLRADGKKSFDHKTPVDIINRIVDGVIDGWNSDGGGNGNDRPIKPFISIAPVAHLMSTKPEPSPATKYSCNSVGKCVVNSNGTYATSDCDSKCSSPVSDD